MGCRVVAVDYSGIGRVVESRAAELHLLSGDLLGYSPVQHPKLHQHPILIQARQHLIIALPANLPDKGLILLKHKDLLQRQRIVHPQVINLQLVSKLLPHRQIMPPVTELNIFDLPDAHLLERPELIVHDMEHPQLVTAPHSHVVPRGMESQRDEGSFLL